MSRDPVAPGRYDGRYYEESCGGVEFFKAFGAKILKPQQAYSFQKAELAASMRALDIGCGRGEILYHVRQAGAWGAGTDFSGEALKKARETSGAPVLLCDAKFLPFQAASFDRVFFLGVMDHLHDWELKLCFSEIARILKPGGLVLVHTCANRHYYKNWTYALRRAAAGFLRLPPPEAPRSAQDAALHVNEHTLGGMRRFFNGMGWKASVSAMPNYKLLVGELYGETLPPDFPLRPAPPWKAWAYRTLLFRGPLKDILAREFFAVARPGGGVLE